jgi:hypothetical protein
MKSPAQVRLKVGGSDVEFFAVLHMVEMLMRLGRPLPPALRARLGPWNEELRQRRERLLADNRRADANYLPRPNATVQRYGKRADDQRR